MKRKPDSGKQREPQEAAGAAGRRYWVVGAVYASTEFSQPMDGGPEERVGPFPTYQAALEAWKRLAWQTVDNCHARYRIEVEPTANE
jgi:Domain of unknown function (DUF4170)